MTLIGEATDESNKINYLYIAIGIHLNWTNHFNNIPQKISKYILSTLSTHLLLWYTKTSR